jgi:hypothetical protein
MGRREGLTQMFGPIENLHPQTHRIKKQVAEVMTVGQWCMINGSVQDPRKQQVTNDSTVGHTVPFQPSRNPGSSLNILK